MVATPGIVAFADSGALRADLGRRRRRRRVCYLYAGSRSPNAQEEIFGAPPLYSAVLIRDRESVELIRPKQGQSRTELIKMEPEGSIFPDLAALRGRVSNFLFCASA